MMENCAFAILRKAPIKDFPISITEAKSFLGIHNSNDDELLRFLIMISTDYAQWFIEKSLSKQTWQLSYDIGIIPRRIYLPFGPLIAISTVCVRHGDDAKPTVLDNSMYTIDDAQSSVQLDASVHATKVEIVYDSGYTNLELIPTQIRYGILHHTAISYKNRNYIDAKHLSFLKEMYIPFREVRLVL